jgi:hypothetical protein
LEQQLQQQQQQQQLKITSELMQLDYFCNF